MTISGFESNEFIMQEIGRRLQKYRIDMGMTQKELAEKAGISLRTVVSFEKGSDIKMSLMIKVLRSLNMASNIDLLVPETLVRPSDYLELNKQRKRVRKKETADKQWKWGEDK